MSAPGTGSGATLVLCSFPDRTLARTCADALVEEHLCAAAQVLGPVYSRYRWQGEVRRREEWWCVARTGADRVEAICAAVRARHPDEVPSIVAVPASGGPAEYLAWMVAGGEA